MKKVMLMLVAVSLVAVGSAFGISSAGAHVSAHAAKAKKKAGKRGPRGYRGYRGYTGATGATGATGPAGPTGAAAPSSSSTSTAGNNFNALVPANGTESVTIGSFTIREVASGTACSNVNLVDNSSYAGYYQTGDPKAASVDFLPMASLTPYNVLTAGATPATSTSVSFTAVLATGTSEMVGTIGTLPISSGCLTVGSVQGQ